MIYVVDAKFFELFGITPGVVSVERVLKVLNR